MHTPVLGLVDAHRGTVPTSVGYPHAAACCTMPPRPTGLLSVTLRPGDCYCLYGDVGAGKSVFSRAFIRHAAQDDGLPVPSPTFLLQVGRWRWRGGRNDGLPAAGTCCCGAAPPPHDQCAHRC